MALEITGASKEVMVGELIKLGINFTDDTWGTVKKVTWTIPGTIVKNYKDGQMTAEVTPFDEAEKKEHNVSFYWVDGEEGRTVKAEVEYETMDGTEKTEPVEAKFDVKRPTCKFTCKYGEIRICDAMNEYGDTRFGVHYGGTAYNVGVEWEVSVTTPGIGEGYIKDVQLIKTKRTSVKTTETKVVDTKGHWELDHMNPYTPLVKPTVSPAISPPLAQGIQESGHTGEIGGGATEGFTSNDNPDNLLTADMTSLSLDDEFKLWVMYMPKKEAAIWVPLKLITWRWGVSVARAGGRWPPKATVTKEGGDGAALTPRSFRSTFGMSG